MSEKKDLRIVFMGTPEIAVASLQAILQAGYTVVGVVTAPDKPAGRGRKIQLSEVKKFALDQNLRVLQPTNLKSDEFLRELTDLRPDVQVVVAFRMLPRAVWALPPLGTFNMHASLLPQYRGAAPINWAVINGETQTGVTTFFLDEEIDTGRIIDFRQTEIFPHDTAGTLHDRIKTLGAGLVVETLNQIAAATVTTRAQEELINQADLLKKAPKIFRDDCRIDWTRPGREIQNLIRGLSPVPGAFTELGKQEQPLLMKIYEAGVIEESHHLPPGRILSDNKNFIRVSTIDGYIEVKSMQAAGKKRMETPDFLRGFDISPYVE